MSNRTRQLPLWRLVWRNTQRHTRRTLLTASAVAVAVAAMIVGLGFVGGMLNGILETTARTETGHVRIRQNGYSEREQFLPVHLSLRHVSQLLPVIQANAQVEAALPRIRTSVLVDGTASNRPALLMGLDMQGEEHYWSPAAYTAAGRLPERGRSEVMVGEGLAVRLGVGIGDTLTLLGQTAYRSLGGIRLAVTGIAASGVSFLDNSILLTPLDQAQLLTDLEDGATEVVVFAHETDRAPELARELESALSSIPGGNVEVRSWQDQSQMVRTLQTARSVFGFILMLLLLMASLVIINTMLMTVMERTQEFGMQAALGMRRRDIVKLIVGEGLVIGLLGGLVGALLGTGLSIWITVVGVDFTQATQGIDIPFQGIVRGDWKPVHTVACTAAGTLTAGLAAYYPALRGSRLAPAEALRA